MQAHKDRLQEATDDSKEITSDLHDTVGKHSQDATTAAKDAAQATSEKTSELAEDGKDKISGVSSSSS